MTVVLGINGLPSLHLRHDPGAALLVDGQVTAAVEEERLSRSKRAVGLAPCRAVGEVLDVADVSLADVDVITYPWSPSAMGESERSVAAMVKRSFGGKMLRRSVTVRFVEHHTAHAWSGLVFVPGGIRGRRIGVLVLDGSGESTSGAGYVYDGELQRMWHLAQSASLGAYYEAVSVFLGFGAGEEGKTMGLASYGRDVNIDLPRLPDRRFTGSLPRRQDDPELSKDSFTALRANLVSGLRSRHPGPLTFQQRADIARAAERYVERRILGYATELLGEVEVLVMSGGCALNCTINAQVAEICRAANVELVIPPPASDTGVALGSAVAGSPDPSAVTPVAEPFLGRWFGPDEIARELHNYGLSVSPVERSELASALIERSMVCGWFQGRSEIGPRALGKRSILGRPDLVTVRDRINRLKGREAWRPLAPSMTVPAFQQAFPGATPSPHMLIAALASAAGRRALEGVIHVDGSSRPQVVRTLGPYRELLAEVGKLSDIEAITCTSFNQAGEPMVYSPSHALTTARAMGLDILAGDGWWVRLNARS